MAKLDNNKASDGLDDDVEPAADVLDGDIEEEEDEEDLDSWKLEEDLE